MRSKILVVLIAVAVMGVSSAAIARSGGGKGGSGGHVGHAHFGHRFLRNQFLVGGWGWGGDWGWPYGESGYSNTNVVVYPQATPQIADVTGSAAATPCHWNAETFAFPSSAGGTRQVQVVGCR
jgi:hypothetical protein